MRLFARVCALFALAILLPPACYGQTLGSTSVELDVDVRSLTASAGKSHVGLYSTALSLKSSLGSGFRVLYGGSQTTATTVSGHGLASFVTRQAAIEHISGQQRFLAGNITLPFGLYDTEETYASGLIDYPLARVDKGFSSVDWFVPGVGFRGGSPALQIEAAGFGGQASGVWGNRNNVAGGALRLQSYYQGLIVGASRWDGSESTGFGKAAAGRLRTHLSGFDMRFTRPHLLVRGEYLFGTLGNAQTHGWYTDFYYHLPKYERWTIVARAEQFQPASNIRATDQVTLGARYTLDRNWIFAANWRRNNGVRYGGTWTPTTGR